jgi:oligopeptide transport system ATP-binding protein
MRIPAQIAPNKAEPRTAHPLLQVRDLCVDFTTGRGDVRAVAGIALEVQAGECLAVVGESGSGKTQVLLACLGLLADNGRASGSARFQGHELIGAGEEALNAVRGTGMALLSQDPMSALTPHLRIEKQLTEGLLDRRLATPAAARGRALELLREVEIPDPEQRLQQYPHELSGGMRQRVALAMALMCGPRLLLADEPTTALDVSVQARILELLRRVRAKGIGILIITHDLGVVAGIADRVAVMYSGRIVECASAVQLFDAPAHPYTAALLAAVPRLHGAASDRLASIAGQPPRPGEITVGCAFAPRCAYADERCAKVRPELSPAGPAHESQRTVACHYPLRRTVPEALA